jgi:protein phosphatase PTC1
MSSESYHDEFEDYDPAIKVEDEEIVVRNAPSFTSVKSVGTACDRNARYRRTMEDAHIYFDNFGKQSHQGYFAVYDGHGGRQAVEFIHNTLHTNVDEEVTQQSGKVVHALERAFIRTDEQMRQKGIMFPGTCSAVGLVQQNSEGKFLYTANVGDTRIILNRGGTAVRLTKDDKTSDPDEIKRIQDAGGFVANGRVNGLLAVTRSLGNVQMKQYIISTPHTAETRLTEEDKFFIIACDGVWDVMTDQEAVDMLKNETDPTKMSEMLLLASLTRGSTDNITVMVVFL